MPDCPSKENGVRHTDAAVEVLLDLIETLASELRPYKRRGASATLDSLLEEDLGLYSLARVELVLRLERTFGVRLPEQLLVTAETPRDLLRIVRGANAVKTPVGATAVKGMAWGKVAAAPIHACTLVEALNWHVSSHPKRLHIYLYGDADGAEEITYAALEEGAAAVAAGLQERGLQPGQRVAMMLPTGRDFFYSFYGVLLAGGIPVPIYPPMRPSQIEDHLRRQASILTNALACMLITVHEAQGLARLLTSQVEGLRTVVTVQELSSPRREYAKPDIQAQDIALLQYTSGSTAIPKGVVLTHANLLANIRAMGQVAHTTSSDVCVSWLPLYHDMGLIGAWLGSLYYACPLVLMPPLAFLARPERWLWAIHTHRGTFSAAPNFAYELCLRKIDDRAIEGLDLSSWRMALNGAEPVSPETIIRFCDRFAKYGFRPEAMTPVYGLAEASLGLAFPPPGRGLLIDRIKREPFMRFGHAEPAEAHDLSALCFTACGQPLPGHQVRIVDATGYEVAERQVGRLQFLGPSTTSGYFRNLEETRRLFHGEWLDSGDLAYIAGGDVYPSGRTKDIIIRAGRNIYPHELEEAIGDVHGVRKGCVAVFGSTDPISGTERLVILAETRETEPRELDHIRHRVDTVVMDLLGTPADEVILAPPHTVLKTSSGKIRRAASRERYEEGCLEGNQRAVWWQLTRLAFLGVIPQMRRAVHNLADVLCAAYRWTLFGVLAPVVWIGVAILPRLPWRQAVVRAVARLMLRLFGIPLFVHGLEHLPRHGPYVLVVNHASYLDPLVLVAVLPTDISYVAKRELTDRFISRVLFNRIGVEFVERFDPLRGVADAERVLQVVSQGRSMVFFPEGTFGRGPGLRPFHMGAFIVATRTGVPVVPLAISGTRSILRSGQWFPRRGTVHIAIGAPIIPQGAEWTAAIKLRDAARAWILQSCGEPDLVQEIV